MATPVLRDYQLRAINDVREALRHHRTVVLQSPTGSGKTVTMAHMMRTAADVNHKSAVFLVHRRELVDQASDALRSMDVEHGLISGGRSGTDDLVQVATIQTLVRRLDRIRAPDLIVIDEAHHTAAASYRKVLERWPDSYVVGLTATPCRTDQRGLDDLFNALVLGPSVSWLMDRGYLARYRVLAPPSDADVTGVHHRGGDYVRGELADVVDTPAVVGDAVAHYREFVRGSCLVYCVTRAHARHVEAAYRVAGIDARYCAGDTPAPERNAIVRGLRRGNPPVVVSVDLFGEGLDAPGLSAIQILRHTESLTLHLQMCGRVLRPEAGKDYALILDHVGNTLRHGLPDQDREWTLEGTRGGGKKSEDSGPAIRACEHCFAVYASTLPACPVCGAVPTVLPRMPDEVDGKLKEIDQAEIQRRRQLRREEGMAASNGLEALVTLAIERGYSPAWAGIRQAIRAAHAQGRQQPTPAERGRAIAEARRIHRELQQQEV
jgi:DNA repair protein RadD